MATLAPTLKMALESIITSPKRRSSKWISTSVPESRWTSESACYASADYHVNNFCSPVLFQEGLQQIPSNAICVEIAPHALLQAVLRRSLPKQVTCIPLCKKDIQNQCEHFWSQLGQMYIAGCNLDTVKLMIPSEFEQTIYPVPVRTGSVSHLVQWNHEQQWTVPKCEDFMFTDKNSKNCLNNTFTHTIDMNEQDMYLSGHQIDGRVIYPATGYLYLVWQTFASMKGLKVDECPIRFENVEIHSAKVMDIKDKSGRYQQINFVCTISPASGLFEVLEDQKCVASGQCFLNEQSAVQFRTQSNMSAYRQCDLLQKKEIYRDLALRGYEYSREFQSIVQCNLEGNLNLNSFQLRFNSQFNHFHLFFFLIQKGTEGQIMWCGKWIPFLDAMLQMNVMNKKNGLMLPTRIRLVTIDPKLHFQLMKKCEERSSDLYNQYQSLAQQFQQLNCEQLCSMSMEQQSLTPNFSILPVQYDQYTNMTVCGAVQIGGLHATWAPKKQWTQPTVLERVNFVPYVEKQFDTVYHQQQQQQQFSLCSVHNTQNCTLCAFETIDSASSEKRQMLEYYMEECNRYCSHILSKIQNPMTCVQQIESIGQPQKWTSCSKSLSLEGGKLLEILKTCSSMDSTDGQYFYKVQKMFTDSCNYWKALESDLVLNCMTRRNEYLKNFIDIVIENTSSHKQVRILEISPSIGQFFGQKVHKLMKTYPQVTQIDYHYVSLSTENSANLSQQFDEEMWNEFNCSSPVPIKRTHWNICPTQNGLMNCQLPVNLKDFDCVIFNGTLSTLLPFCQSESELKCWLNKVCEQAVRPSGFAMINEHTNCFQTLKQLNKLEETVFRQFTPSNQQYMSEEKWRQIIDQSGLKPVALKSDSILSTMFLYRRPFCPSTSSRCEEKICIDDIAQYQWIEKVKAALNRAECQRVWLISEKSPSSGIVGLVNCMRREIGGDKIRCIFMSDNKPVNMHSWLIPTTTAENTCNIQKRSNYSFKFRFEI
jgi:fatty acid synthase, animal type